jgi:hypothetical protein
MQEKPELDVIVISPDPVIEAYKRDVDRTLVIENLKLTTSERIKKMESAAQFAETLRRSRAKPDAM